ncbi:MAG TPA: NUDIX domain-containing protein [Acidimicrobiales bacterium]
MRDRLHLRQAVRAVVLDEVDRVLLARFEFPPSFGDTVVWATPGGGIEDGEDELTALARELVEELGLRDAAIGPLIWTRTHILPMSTGHDGQHERYYLVRTPAFDPRPALSEAELRAEYVAALRWWTAGELAAADSVFAPRRLPQLVTALVTEGPPPGPVDVGV